MAVVSIDDILRAELSRLYARLHGECKRAVSHLEAQISALEAENRHLQVQLDMAGGTEGTNTGTCRLEPGPVWRAASSARSQASVEGVFSLFSGASATQQRASCRSGRSLMSGRSVMTYRNSANSLAPVGLSVLPRPAGPGPCAEDDEGGSDEAAVEKAYSLDTLESQAGPRPPSSRPPALELSVHPERAVDDVPRLPGQLAMALPPGPPPALCQDHGNATDVSDSEQSEPYTTEDGANAQASEHMMVQTASECAFKLNQIWSQKTKHHNNKRVTRERRESLCSENGIYVGQGWLTSSLQRWILQPGSPYRLGWEIMIAQMLLFDMFVVPVQLLDLPENLFYLAAAWVTRVFWTADILVSFFTGYDAHTVRGRTEMEFWKVAKRYASTQLPFDAVIVSCDWVEAIAAASDGTSSHAMSVLRAVQVLRLTRFAKARNILEFVLEHVRSEAAMILLYVLTITFGVIFFIHVIACIWYIVQTADAGGSGSFLSADASFTERYMFSFHYVLGLFVGEHIQLPVTKSERFFTVVVLLIAFIVTATFVGSLTTAMTRLQVIASKRSAQFAVLKRYLSQCRISTQLSVKVQRNARHTFNESHELIAESSVELLHLISEPLRVEIHYEVNSPTLLVHPFFFLYNKVNLRGVRHICHTVLQPIAISRGDVLFSEFELPLAPRMFFVKSGNLIYHQGGQAACAPRPVAAGAWVSEATLWTDWVHRGSLVARAEGQLVSLDAHRFATAELSWGTTHTRLYSLQFVKFLNEARETGCLTDLAGESEKESRLAFDVFQETESERGDDWAASQYDSWCSERRHLAERPGLSRRPSMQSFLSVESTFVDLVNPRRFNRFFGLLSG